MSDIAVIGTGYVGLVTGAVLSDFGHRITCVDTDAEKIEGLRKGIIPIYEPGLEPVVQKNSAQGRLRFTTDTRKAVRENGVVVIAVGTPSAEDGSADLQYVEAVAREIAQAMEDYKVIVDKSTVPIGTGARVKAWVREELAARGQEIPFDVVSCPEFLREGSAVRDFTHPDRVVLGTESRRALDTMREVYRVLYLNETPFVATNLETAEMIKYSANAYLAMKITFINEVANLCETVGADVQDVARALGRDGRISPKFLHAGPGYGGSCFPKDTRAMADIARHAGSPLPLIEQTIRSNRSQRERMIAKIAAHFDTLEGKTLAVLGLTFKPNTDDMRESPALTILQGLAGQGARLQVYDPAGAKEASWRLKEIEESVVYAQDEYAAMEGADALILLTEWNQFRNLSWERAKGLLQAPVFFDLRNVYPRDLLEEHGFTYYGVGV